MAWTGLETLIRKCLRRADLIESIGGDLKWQAGILSCAVFGENLVLECPTFINVAALALAMRDRLIVHQLSAGARAYIHSTDLRTLPGQPPDLLKKPFLITARKPEEGETLFGDVAQIGGYWADDTLFLVLFGYPDGVYVYPWKPVWQEIDVDDVGFSGGFISDVAYSKEKWEDLGHQAIRFLLVLGLMLQAEGSPVVVERPPRAKKSGPSTNSQKRSRDNQWSTRRIYVDGKIRYSQSERQSDGTDGGTRKVRDDLQEMTVMVSGYIRRQPYGPKNSLRKWIYVRSYEARRWVAPKPLRINVASLQERRT